MESDFVKYILLPRNLTSLSNDCGGLLCDNRALEHIAILNRTFSNSIFPGCSSSKEAFITFNQKSIPNSYGTSYTYTAFNGTKNLDYSTVNFLPGSYFIY
jgi:hypothetical protein